MFSLSWLFESRSDTRVYGWRRREKNHLISKCESHWRNKHTNSLQRGELRSVRNAYYSALSANTLLLYILLTVYGVGRRVMGASKHLQRPLTTHARPPFVYHARRPVAMGVAYWRILLPGHLIRYSRRLLMQLAHRLHAHSLLKFWKSIHLTDVSMDRLLQWGSHYTGCVSLERDGQQHITRQMGCARYAHPQHSW